MNRTKIPWATHSCNPFEGCSAASAGCDRCYAASLAHRFHRHWGYPIFKPMVLSKLKRKPCNAIVFMCSASDLFHERNSIDDITMVLDSMYAHPQHKYIMLTKRPERIAEAFGTSGIYPQPNWWIGVSAENQQMFDKRYPYICQYENTVVSVEPMLSKVEIPDGCRASWIIAGPETGAGKRPCNDAWIDNLEFECFMQGIPFFDKRDGQRTRQFAKGIK